MPSPLFTSLYHLILVTEESVGVLGLICILRPPEVILEQTDSGFERRTGQSASAEIPRTAGQTRSWNFGFPTSIPCVFSASQIFSV
jgi:hypothetical protein